MLRVQWKDSKSGVEADLPQGIDQDRPRIYVVSDKETLKISKQGNDLIILVFFEIIIVAAGRVNCRKGEKSKDATAVIQAISDEGLCQGRNSRNADGGYIQNISISKQKKKVGLANWLDIEVGRTKVDIKCKGTGRTAKLNLKLGVHQMFSVWFHFPKLKEFSEALPRTNIKLTTNPLKQK